jgi:hypothetical protein
MGGSLQGWVQPERRKDSEKIMPAELLVLASSVTPNLIRIEESPGAAPEDLSELNAEIGEILRAVKRQCLDDPGARDVNDKVLRQVEQWVDNAIEKSLGTTTAAGQMRAQMLEELAQLKHEVDAAGRAAWKGCEAVLRDELHPLLSEAIDTGLKNLHDKQRRRDVFAETRVAMQDVLEDAEPSKSITVAIMNFMIKVMESCDVALQKLADKQAIRQGRLGDMQAAKVALQKALGSKGDDEPIDPSSISVTLDPRSPMRGKPGVGDTVRDTVTFSEMSDYYRQTHDELPDMPTGFPLAPQTVGQARAAIETINDRIVGEGESLKMQMIDQQQTVGIKRTASEIASTTTAAMSKLMVSFFGR